MTTSKRFIKHYSLLLYYAVVFLISWGGMLWVGSRGMLSGTSWQTDPTFQVAVLALLLGPPVAGILLTGLVAGGAGYRDLITRLVKWRVNARWYVVALLIAPLVQLAVLLALAPISPRFLPSIVTADDKVALLLAGIGVGLVGGFVEELGWTGFAIPRLRLRYGVLTTGLVVGILWGAWHLLQMWWVGSTSAETLPLPLFLLVYFLAAIAQLTAYRVLMVWVYDHTESLLVAILMHASYIFSTLFVLAPPITGAPFLTYSALFTVVLWVIVAAVALVDRGHISPQRLDQELGVAGHR